MVIHQLPVTTAHLATGHDERVTDDSRRAAWLSGARSYLRDADPVLAQLTAIPGIGPWTVQGALIVALQREDVVLPGDLALRKAIQAAYQLDHLPAQPEVLAIAEKWRPYRSLATSYLFSAAFEPAGEPPLSVRGTH
jgi:3-methyladenine DNA glycosylase/8-oxoguanine DNA glycosylase